MSVAPAFIVVVVAAALIIGFGKGGLGGIVLIVVPLMSTALAISLLWGVVGTIIGTYIVAGVDDTLLRRVIGLLTLVYIGYRVASALLASTGYDPARWVAWLAGFVAGVTSSLAAAGSPAFTAYYLLKRPEPHTFMGTFTVFFAVSNAVKVPFFVATGLLTWPGFVSVAWVIPAPWSRKISTTPQKALECGA
jgi:uncharacterized protein